MSSFLCFLCHNTVNSDTNEETREKYREIVGMNLCPDSHLCYICCYMLNKLWLFKSVCLKRSLEYPVLFSEKGTLNLQRNYLKTIIICSEETCMQNNVTQFYIDNDNRDQLFNSNDYMKLEDDCNNFDEIPENTSKAKENNTTQEFDNIKQQFENCDKDFDNNDEQFENNERQFENCDKDFENNERQFENCDKDFDNIDEQFENNECQFENCDKDFDNIDEQFENNEHQFENNEHQFENCDKDFDNDEQFESNIANNIPSPSERNILEFELNKDHETAGDEINYECYDDERKECLEEIRNEETTENEGTSKTKSKSKKKEKNNFEKILLSIEEQKSELEAQRKSKKYIEAEFKCYNCALGFLFKDTYQAHMMRHEESNGEYRCLLCSLRFATGAVLRSHASLHSVRYRCSRCAQIIRARRTQTHAKYCHDKTSAATCHLCGRVFLDASGLQQHLKRFHMSKTSNRTYSCSVCGKRYYNQAAVRTHMIKHIHRKFNCDECSSTFSSPYTLQQHKKRHSSGDSASDHCCSTCGARFSSRKSLLAHERSAANHSQRLYECPICSRSCPNERSLTSHISTVHSSTKPFRCPTCPAKYSSRKSLVRHVRAHTVPPQPKIAVCHICGNSFKGKSKLNRHLREVCEKDKLEEELSSYYEQQNVI